MAEVIGFLIEMLTVKTNDRTKGFSIWSLLGQSLFFDATGVLGQVVESAYSSRVLAYR